MTKEQNKIFVADEQMEFKMKRYPEYVDFKEGLKEEGFEIVPIDKADKATLDKINVPLVRSELFLHNQYYPLLDCVEKYITDLAMGMEDLAKFMGASEWYFDYKYEKSDTYKESSKQEATIGGKVPKYGGGDISVGKTDISQTTQMQTLDIKRETKLKGSKLEPKELEKYIQDKGINLDAFGDFFKKSVKDYISGEKISTNETDIDKTEQINQYVEIGRSCAVIPKIKVVDAKLKLNLDKKFGNGRKYRTRFHYKMIFSEKV